MGVTLLPSSVRAASGQTRIPFLTEPGSVIHLLPGQASYADITLRYGLTNSRQLWEWFLTSMRGKVERRNISIVLVDNDGVTEAMRWNLINAWIPEWRGAPLNASSHEVAIESMTIVVETLERS